MQAADAGERQCFALAPAVAVVDTVAGIDLVAPSTTGAPWTVLLSFQPAQQAQIAAYTSAHHRADPAAAAPDPVAADYLATVVDGYVLQAPDIEAPIDGPMSIEAGMTKSDAQAFYATLAAQ